MSSFPRKPGGLPVAEEQARLNSTGTGVPAHTRMQRVRVYCLTDEGKWDDHGTGHVTIDYIKGSRELALAVVDEKDSDTLLLHNITSDDIYRKQEERIISWKDPEQSLELALSFQEASGCSYIWDSIHNIQQNLQLNVLRSQVGPHPALESQEASREYVAPFEVEYESLVSVHGELKDLPPLELSSLPLMLKIILAHGTADQMRVAELICQDHEYFPKLVNIFRLCESLKNMDGLHQIFRLVKGMILLNNSAIFEKIFSDAFILDIIGTLEYDPEVHNVQNHRTFLREHVVFKEAIPIRNASVVSKIHQTYRIGYIKDVILPRALDDATLASLNSIIRANNAIVTRVLKDDASFIHELMTRMKSPNISAESKSKLVLFLHEFCTLSKSLQLVQQLQLSRDLVSEGVLDIISDVLQSHDEVVASTGTSILIHFLEQDPNLILTYIAHQDQNCLEGSSLLEILIQGIVTGSGVEMHFQCFDILRTLMDSSPVDMDTNHKEVAIQIFYEKHFHKLIDVIASSCRPKGVTQSSAGSVGAATMVEHPAKPEILLNICELLCFCVLHHPDRIKLNFFSNKSLEKILTLTQQREKSLVVAAVRFMRTVIGTKDEFLIDRVIKFNLLKPIIEAFVENGDRYNMLHSGVLELLEYIRKENIELLIEPSNLSINRYWRVL
ncbi:hypothetical protein QOZ80_5BG0452470 [Eleusine coracana subsp. coracana]|nr:hypothetical protein QOZ80_5BG0452470 [Eleusine coracana subsp. coracana]